MRADLRIRKRIAFTLSILTLLFLWIGVRIGSLTLFQGKALTARGVAQWTREGVVTAQRGAIFDRNGDIITQSTTAYIVSANPQLISQPEATAALLAPILDTGAEGLSAKMGKKGQAMVMLKRQVPREQVDQIREMRMSSEEMRSLLKGISFDEDPRRFYPKGTFLAQVLGLTNVDSQGQSGLESRYEALLKGREGLLKTEVDAKARMLPDGETVYVPPEDNSPLKALLSPQVYDVRPYPEEMEIAGIRITTFPVRHPVPCRAIRLEAEGKTLVFTGDTNTCEGLADFSRGADALLADAAFLETEWLENKPHLSALKAAQLAGAAQVKKLYLTHLPVTHDARTMEKEAAQAFAAVQAVQPGMEILL